jgi:SAM-dependent methyltransferase
MDTPSYEYYGLKALTWDLSRGDTSGWSDRGFFLEIVRQFGEPVLDVGCGTGRILLDFLAQGIDIDGLDNSAEMLSLCRDKARAAGLSPTLHEQDMQTLALGRTYGTILIPSSTLQLITDADAALRALSQLTAQLRPGGALVSPFGFDWRESEPLDTGWTMKFERIRPEDGARIRGWVHEWREPARQCWHEAERFEVERDGQVIASELHRRSPAGRWYTQSQAVQMFHLAGLARVKVLRGFSHDEPATAEDRLFCVVGVRA